MKYFKCCHNWNTFLQGPLKYTTAANLFEQRFLTAVRSQKRQRRTRRLQNHRSMPSLATNNSYCTPPFNKNPLDIRLGVLQNVFFLQSRLHLNVKLYKWPKTNLSELTATVDPFFPAPPKRIFSNVEGTPNMAATVAKMTGTQRRDMIPKTWNFRTIFKHRF